MTCNLQVILVDNKLIPTKKAITVDEPVSLGPLRSETQSHSSSLRPPFSSNLTTCSFHKRRREFYFIVVLSFLLLSFTLTLISFLQEKFFISPSFSLSPSLFLSRTKKCLSFSYVFKFKTWSYHQYELYITHRYRNCLLMLSFMTLPM